MKYRIPVNKSRTRVQSRRSAIKWVIYVICLILFYILMVSGTFNAWQPFLIIPLAVSVALYERELSSCIFALFCGYFIDIACRFIFGFSAVWLMIICLVASLLSRNLIRINLINFLLIDIAAILLEFSMDYLFNVFLWDIPNREIVFEKSIIPSIVSTLILSPFIYFFVKMINNKLGDADSLNYYTPTTNSDDDEPDYKNNV